VIDSDSILSINLSERYLPVHSK